MECCPRASESFQSLPDSSRVEMVGVMQMSDVSTSIETGTFSKTLLITTVLDFAC